MSVLGTFCDSKLSWRDSLLKLINKTNSVLHCIKQIQYYFKLQELSQIISSNFYSILYKGLENCNIPSLNTELKQNLLTASGNALKMCTPSYHNMSYK